MKRKSNITAFFSGMFITLLLIGTILPATAAAGKNITVYPDVKIYVDDKQLNPTDVNGRPVEVFIYDGTIYLPVRAVSEALGKPVQWDGATQSVYLGKHTEEAPTEWLANMDYFSGTPNNECTILADEKDNLGNMHYHCIVSGNDRYAGAYWNNDFDRTYILNGRYSKISGVIYQTYGARSKATIDKHRLQVYGDGKLLYSYFFQEGATGIKPIDFDVDLTGVLEMKVVFKGSCMRDGHVLSLGDVGLWP